jgi:uncharacterized protein involved in outer membrane biogenesis
LIFDEDIMIGWLHTKKKLLLILSGIAAFIVAGLLVLPLLIDEARVKGLIISRLESSLQRKVSVQSAEITIFTGIGVRLRNVLISEDPGFGGTGFMQVESLRVEPSLLPLLRGRVEFSSIQAVKPVIRLARNAAGVWNFSSVSRKPGAETRSQAAAPSAKSASWAISMLSMRDGAVSVRDQLAGAKAKETQYEHINAVLSGVSLVTATNFLVDVQVPGMGKRTLRAKGEVGPFGSGGSAKIPLNGRVEFSEVPLADLKLLILPSDESELPWQGKLTTQTEVQGDLGGTVHLDGTTKFAGLKSTGTDGENPEISGDLEYKLAYEASSRATRFESAKLQLPGSRVDLSGSIKPQGNTTLLDLKIGSEKSALDDLLKLASVFGQGPPKGVEAKGDGSFHLQVAGSTAKPDVNGQCNFSNFRVRYPGVKEEILVSPVTINFKSPGFNSNEILVSLGERTRLHTQFTGSLGAEKFLSANLRSQNPLPVADLNTIGSSFGVALPQGYSLQNGTINLQLAMKVPFDDAAGLSLNGKAFLSGSQLRAPSLKAPLEVAKANLTFTGNSVTMSDLSGTLSGAKLSGNLQWVNFAAPSLVFSLNVDVINVNVLLSILNTSPASGPAKKASLSESPLSWPSSGKVYAAAASRGSISDPLARVVISDSRISIQQVKYDTFVFSEVASKVRMRNKLLDLDDLQFKMNRGIHNGRASLDFSGSQPRYSLSSRLKSVDANEFLSQNTSLKNLLYGPLSLDLDITASGSDFDGFIRQMRGKGNFSLVNGKITSFDLMEKVAMIGKLAGVTVEQGGTTITSLTAPLQIADGRVSTDNLQMRTPSVAVRAVGSFGLDNKNVDYRILAEVPYQASKKTDLASQLMNLSSATFFRTDKGNLGVPLRMTGNISKPVFALDAQAVQENLKKSLGPKSLESLQNLFKSKKQAEGSSKPDGTEQSPSSPLDDLLNIFDKSKQKKQK